MSLERQSTEPPRWDVRGVGYGFEQGRRIDGHAHPWGQLIYCAEGVLRVITPEAVWLAPPARAVWAAPHAVHEIETPGRAAMRTLYIDPRWTAHLPDRCVAIDVEPLLRELVLHVVARSRLNALDPQDARLIGVVVDRIAAAQPLALSLPNPRDRRARAAAERLRAEPSAAFDLEALAAASGASARTLQRLFKAETGLRLTEWRQKLRLLEAASLLSAGASVTEAGFAAGYASTSAFVNAFRRRLGCTPLRYRAGA
jgi:AraC-like DNA-binding protein